MKVSIEITNKNQFKRFLNNKQKEITNLSRKGLNKAAFFMQGEVKSSIAGRRAEKTSVDTGRFLNSIETQIKKMDAIIFTQIPYAKFLEFGTSKLIARKHFANTKARNINKALKIMMDAIKNI